jgi:hypothetical protein
MIGLSRFRRNRAVRGALPALVLVVSASLASCNIIGTSCNGTNCGDLLTISFDGDVTSVGGWYDGGIADGGAPADAIEIDIEAKENQTFVALATCWFTTGARRQVICDDGQGMLYAVKSLTYSGFDIQLLRVTMSMNGTQLSQQTITPSYATQPCACGADTNHVGTATIPLPSPQGG